MMWGLIIAILFVVLFILVLLNMGEGLLKISAKEAGVNSSDYGIMPNSFRSFLGTAGSIPRYIPEGENFKSFRQGFNINLEGAAQVGEKGIERVRTATYALKPTDFVGMTPIPKLMVQEGDHVKAGDPLFFDKTRPEVIYVAPVSGEVAEIRRADKRAIAEVVILADQGEMQYRSYNLPNLSTVAREELVAFLLESGVWPFIRQRPFDVVADHSKAPKAIFVSTFDTAPLAPNLNLAVEGKAAAFHKGLEILTKLTDGKVHLGLDANGKVAPNEAFTNVNIEGVEKHWFKGQHPAGNVGIHIHHIDPVVPNNAVWYMDVQGVILLGNLFLTGNFNTERLVAITGDELNPRYVWAHQGVNLQSLLTDMPADVVEELKKVKDKDGNKVEKMVPVRKIRIVSGDLLTGSAVKRDGFLGFFDDQVSVLREGDYFELFGWLVPQTSHPSISTTFPTSLFSDVKFVADTNTNGEKRAFVVTGQYESVLPMDIYPQLLLRAIQANDYERMEGLGILEIGAEDIAICEYVCTSKQPLQEILRKGHDMMRDQG